MKLKASYNPFLSDLIKIPSNNKKEIFEDIESEADEEEKDSIFDDPDYLPPKDSQAKKSKKKIIKTPPQSQSKSKSKAPKNKKKTGLTDEFDAIKLSSKSNSKNPKSKSKKKGQKKITKFNAKK